MIEFGQQNPDVVMLLHGGGLRHGDLSLNKPEQYVKILTDWIKE